MGSGPETAFTGNRAPGFYCISSLMANSTALPTEAMKIIIMGRVIMARFYCVSRANPFAGGISCPTAGKVFTA
jgi:hypothetical protein